LTVLFLIFYSAILYALTQHYFSINDFRIWLD